MDSKGYSAIIVLPAKKTWPYFKMFSSEAGLNLRIIAVLLEAMKNSLSSKKIPVLIGSTLGDVRITMAEDFVFYGFEAHQNFFNISFAMLRPKIILDTVLEVVEEHCLEENKILLIVSKHQEQEVRSELKNFFTSDKIEIEAVA
ncbi:MAG: hypothetical protein WCK37_04745 [Candidatus Falkowbacteria bacterium]